MPKQGRVKGQLTAEGQTDLAAGDVAIGAGWGTTATKAITAGSNDFAGQIVVTSAGASQAQATATVVITFKTPYATAPRVVLVTTTNDNSIDTGHATWSATTTALTLTFSVLPVATKVYTLNYACIA
jgi:hypothetical protein